MSCQKKLHSTVKYIGKCLIAVKSLMKRSDECVFSQQRKIMLSEKSCLLRKITSCVLLQFEPWDGGVFIREVLEKLLTDVFIQFNTAWQILKETKYTLIYFIFLFNNILHVFFCHWTGTLNACAKCWATELSRVLRCARWQELPRFTKKST